MEKLSIEAKAKAYDEAIKRLEDIKTGKCQKTFMFTEGLFDYIFPELRESEGERIKGLIYLSIEKGMGIPSAEDRKKALAWLEKQDEMDMESYKAAEDEKREFVGDGFVKCYADFQDFKDGETYWLEYVGNDNYNVRSDNLLGKTYHITPCQLYTVFKKQTWLEKQGEQKSVKVPKFKVGDFIQFNGMGHTRYTIKEVCGSSHYINTCNKRMDMSYTDANFELVEQKTAEWSEEDKRKIDRIYYILRQASDTHAFSTSCRLIGDKECIELQDFLKSLRPQKHWKPSDEQMSALKEQCVYKKSTVAGEVLCELFHDLEKLREE